MLTMKLNEIKSYTFANENKSPVNKIQLSTKKKDTDCGHSMEAAESRDNNVVRQGPSQRLYLFQIGEAGPGSEFVCSRPPF